MQDDVTINSSGYWDRRFAGDWEHFSGREQTAFFARVAVGAMPQWLIHEIRKDRLSVCDWGCAEGDGVDVLTTHLGVPVVGVDFSSAAIEKARAYYPSSEFRCVDFLVGEDEGATLDEFDVVFSSNTLEHFSTPWDVFPAVARRSRRYVVLLVPFQEYERHKEHFTTFDFNSIPLARGAQRLVSAVVIDTAAMAPSYWPGLQVLLVYCNDALVERMGLTWAEARLDHPDHLSLKAAAATHATKEDLQHVLERQDRHAEERMAVSLATLRELRDELATANRHTEATRVRLEQLHDELERKNAEVVATTAQLDASNRELEVERHQATALSEQLENASTRADSLSAQLDDLHGQHERLRLLYEQILTSNSWRLTRPLRQLRRWLGGSE